MSDKCIHNTSKGLSWVGIKKIKRFGFWNYIMIEKECNNCGIHFMSDTKGRRLYEIE